jgi:regulator of sigma E protease
MIIGGAPGDVVGPVGIVQFTGEVARAGVSPVLEFAALISMVLGIANLLPLPALDGGRIVFVLLEWVRRGKRVSPRTEGLIHAIGFFLLIGLMVVVTYQDIARIAGGGGLP